MRFSCLVASAAGGCLPLRGRRPHCTPQEICGKPIHTSFDARPIELVCNERRTIHAPQTCRNTPFHLNSPRFGYLRIPHYLPSGGGCTDRTLPNGSSRKARNFHRGREVRQVFYPRRGGGRGGNVLGGRRHLPVRSYQSACGRQLPQNRQHLPQPDRDAARHLAGLPLRTGPPPAPHPRSRPLTFTRLPA